MEGSSSQEQNGGGEEETKNEEEELMAKAQRLMDKITSSADNPNPTVLHALSSLFDIQESLYVSAYFISCYALHSFSSLFADALIL